ncbi:hypothetical protein MKX03_035962 [Papaver bracteatum]|nr:hypothetical protein MKX03_035962 [Papaver bracteatum]
MPESGKIREAKKIMEDHKLEKTFVLAYPCFSYNSCIGNMMRCMNMSEDFAREHLNNIKWNPDAFDRDLPSGNWVGYLSSKPVVAMIMQGDNSIEKALYASESGEKALLDISLWFRDPKFFFFFFFLTSP